MKSNNIFSTARRSPPRTRLFPGSCLGTHCLGGTASRSKHLCHASKQKKRESDAPAEPYRAATGRPQARGTVFAAAKTSAGASPSQPVFSLVKMQIKMFRVVVAGSSSRGQMKSRGFEDSAPATRHPRQVGAVELEWCSELRTKYFEVGCR